MSEKNNIPENESEFYGEKLHGAEILQDGTHYTDVVQKEINKKRITVGIIVAVALVVIVGIILFFTNVVFDNPEPKVQETSTVTEEAPAEENIANPTPDYEDPAQPMTNLVEEIPEVNNDEEVTAFVEENSFQTSTGNILTFDELDAQGTVNKCLVQDSTDFCYAGNIDKEYDAYYIKNAINSRFFEAPQNFTIVESDELTAATMTIETLDGTATPVLVVVHDDGSGYMFVNKDKNDDFSELINDISM